MTTLAHGVDLVEVARITEMLEKHGPRFLDRCFTEAERADCFVNEKRSDERLAARFAAKEAALKALGTGWVDGIAWTDVEVVRLPSGEPTLLVTGRAEQIAAGRGITGWRVSLSHTATHAMASVIATG